MFPFRHQVALLSPRKQFAGLARNYSPKSEKNKEPEFVDFVAYHSRNDDGYHNWYMYTEYITRWKFDQSLMSACNVNSNLITMLKFNLTEIDVTF